MKVKMILPALTEAKSPYFRPIKYSLFPPLGLATLAGYLAETDDVTLQDEHVERLRHAAYAGGWKKFEPMWDLVIRAKQASSMLPVLESVLSAFGRYAPRRDSTPRDVASPPRPLTPDLERPDPRILPTSTRNGEGWPLPWTG